MLEPQKHHFWLIIIFFLNNAQKMNENKNYENILVFDTETNGLNFCNDDLLSIGWVKVRKYDNDTIEYVERAEYFVLNDDVKNKTETLKINKIEDEFRNEYGKPIEEILRRFKESVKGCDVYAFNVRFDVGFVEKYDEEVFKEAKSVGEIQIHPGESVINSLQRIIYDYYGSFNHWIYISDHLHSAFDDSVAELIILFHDVYGMSVEDYFISVDEFEPVVGSGQYKNILVSEMVKNRNYLKWFMYEKQSEYEDYLRDYISQRMDVSDYVAKKGNLFYKALKE